MTKENYWALGTVALDARDDICAAGLVFKDLVLNAMLIEDLLEKLRSLNLISRRIGRIDSEVLLHQLHSHILITRPIDPPRILRMGQDGSE
jgi:hypothetical protein